MGKRMAKFLLGLFVWLALCASSWAVTLLPNGKQQFIDGNGNPLAGGKVYFYVPSTTTPKNTWSDAAGTILNSNPVILDSNGYGVIYGSGSYRQVVKTSADVTVWDQLTADTSSASGVSWAGAGAGTANAQTITASAFTQTDGQIIYYRPTVTNTGAMSLTVNGGSPIAVYIDTDNGSSASLQGGEVAAGTVVGVAYSSTDGFFHLITNNFHALVAPQSIAAAATTNIGSLSSNVVNVTGATTITSFGSAASKSQSLYFVSFSGINYIIYNATSLLTPTGNSILTGAGDSAILAYLGSGNWQVVAYMPSTTPNAHVNAQTGTSYTLDDLDRGAVVTLSNASAITVTVPQATGEFGSGFYATLSNIGSSWVTVNFTTSTFAGLSSTTIPPYTSLQLMSDGTNWVPMGSILQQSGRFLLNTITVSGAVAQDTTSFLLPYNLFEIELINLTYANTCLLQVQASASFQTTTYVSQGMNANSGGVGQINSTSGVICSKNTAGGLVAGKMYIANPNSAATNKIFYSSGLFDVGATTNVVATTGTWNGSSAAITGFQIAGNATGTIKVYGWR